MVNYFHRLQLSNSSHFPRVTYGMPRSGNKPYADFMNGQDQLLVSRVVNNGDVCPHKYLAKYEAIHHGPELWITPSNKNGEFCATNVYEDPDCSNSLGPIYSLLDHLDYWDVAYHYCAVKDPLSTVRGP